MSNQQHFIEEYESAMRVEHELWNEIRAAQASPGHYSKELWDRWIEAVAKTTAASKALREAYLGTEQPARVPGTRYREPGIR